MSDNERISELINDICPNVRCIVGADGKCSEKCFVFCEIEKLTKKAETSEAGK